MRGTAEGARGERRGTEFEGQVVLVTGGSRGFGFLLAREFAREGAKLVLCARSADQLERARRDLEAAGADVLTIPCDVSDRDQADMLIAEATARFGRVDVLVNNAGIIQVGPAETMTHEQYREAMDINFWGTLNPTLAVLPQMLERRRGRIVNITSIGAKLAVPHLLPYTCAKWAQQGFSEGLRAEMARHGIKVTAIAPATMRTGSYVNVEVTGKHDAEYGWFALSSSLPLLSIDAERAARQVVEAAARGRSQQVLGLQAKAAALAHGLFPGTLSDILGVVNRLLPKSDGAPVGRTVRAREVAERRRSPILRAATVLGRSAQARFQHQPVAGEGEESGP